MTMGVIFVNEQEYQKRIQEALESLLDEPPFPNRENIPFIKFVRTYYSAVAGLLEKGFSFEQIRVGFEGGGFLPVGSKTNSLRQAYYRETARRKRVADAGYDPAPWDKKTNSQSGEIQDEATNRNQ
jgi:hypothetical protein